MSRAVLVSVVVPTYNRARFLGDAIESILGQGEEDLEILVVDDGSSDDTEALVRGMQPPVTYLAFEHRGVAAARNRGLAAARGGLVAFLDSDDIWPAGSLATRRAHLDRHREVDVVHGRTILKHIGSSRRRPGPHDADTPIAVPVLGSMLCRRSVFERTGGFDETLAHAEDVDWLARLREARVTIDPIDAIVLEYRIHDGNMTLDVERNQEFLLRALKLSLDRKRR